MSITTPYTTQRQSPWKRLGKSAETAVRMLTMSTRDRIRNWRHVRADRKIALVRDRRGLPSYYRPFLSWTAERFPEIRARMELQLLPGNIRDWSQYSLIVPWIPDTLLYRSAEVRRQALALTAAADSHGTPVINRPERLLSTSKYDCAQRIASLGVRTPQMKRITDVAQFRRDLLGMTLPFLVREDLAHGGRSPVFVVRSAADVQAIPLEKFAEPIAVEFVDVCDPRDQRFRKYRYMAMGDIGVAHTLQISEHWEVRGLTRILSGQTVPEEVAYASAPDPHHELFQHLRRELGLDFLAFDYSHDQQGQLVIWEINVLPGLGLLTGPNRDHLKPALERVMAATLKMYLDRSGIEAPPQLLDFLLPAPVNSSGAAAAPSVQPTKVVAA